MAPRSPSPRLTFGRRQKLKGRILIDTVYKTGLRRSNHPLQVLTLRRPDEKPSRLGISIGRKVGNAVVRNSVKRRIREAYRLMQHELPEGRDWLVVVRPHAVLPVVVYQEKLRNLLR